MADTPRTRTRRPGWITPLVLLVVSLFVFWVIPAQWPVQSIRLEFEPQPSPATASPAQATDSEPAPPDAARSAQPSR